VSPDLHDESQDDVSRLLSGTALFGAALLVVAVVLAAAWGWRTIRIQQHIRILPADTEALVFRGKAPDASLLDRIDLFTGSLGGLSSPALVAAAGVGLRLAASRLRGAA
jgi:hypothetical protein